MDRLNHIFSIDVRSLALVRILLSVIVLQDLVRRAFDLPVFYGDAGVLPSEYLHSFWNDGFSWSLHLIGGGPSWLIASLFVLHALAAVSLLLGYRTTIATALTWFLTVSLHNTNPLILQGEDVLLRSVLFVSLFLPLGAVYSIDRLRRGVPESGAVLSGWSVAYLLQLGFLYFFVALYKHSPEWIGGDAIYYALSIDQYATAFGKYLLAFPAVLSFFTIAILIFQSAALFLLFSPYYTTLVRGTTVVLLMLMHAAFAATMHLGMFSAVSIAGLCGFLPPRWWDAFERWMLSRVPRMEPVIRQLSIGGATGKAPGSYVPALISLVGIAYITYLFIWHGMNVTHPGQYVPFSGGFEVPAKVLRLDQRWNLFAPYPYRDDGWVIVAATLADGRRLDLFRAGEPLSFERPAVIFDLYERPRWRRYFLSLRLEGNARYREPYVRYLCRSWDEAQLGARVESIEVIRMVEWTPAPGEAQEPARLVPLIRWDCTQGSVLANPAREQG